MTMVANIQDPRNLAFEAIARREAHELQLQQKQKNNKRLQEIKRGESSAKFKGLNQEVAQSTSAENTPSKKGRYSFSAHTAARGTEDHPIYLPLSHPVHEKLVNPDHEGNVVNKILHELLQNGDAAENYMHGSRKMKIDDRVRLDNKVHESSISGNALVQALHSHSKRSKKHMSMKQLKKYGSLDVPQELHNFEMFKPVHEMWKTYIMQLLNNVGKGQMAQCLVGADLHGAFILVAHCKMSAFSGVSGIMICETAETFGILTKDNKFKVVLKKISVFMVQVDCWKITLYGDKLTSRKVGQ